MNTREFTKQLREIAETLRPLTELITRETLTWDGAKYAKGEQKKPEPHALAWWSTLSALAELIDRQETALSEKQIAYLDGLLFGGMGSLNDLSFDSNSVGDIAKTINARLDEQRHTLYDSFKGL
jgi:hypothetical protein